MNQPPDQTPLQLMADRAAALDRQAYPAAWRMVDTLPQKLQAEIEKLYRRAFFTGAIAEGARKEPRS